MLSETLIEIYGNIWPMLLIVSIISISIRVTQRLTVKVDQRVAQDIIVYAFVIYVICLFYVVTFQDVSWSSSNYIPFKEMLRYDFGSTRFYSNILGNLIMFMPFGLFTAYFLEKEKAMPIFIISLLTSSTIEVTQHFIGRVFDIDDIILNVLGALIGYLVYYLFKNFKEALPKKIQQPIVFDVVVSTISILMVVYFIKIIIGG
jgi:glycopeptide antibiotics resistance protein